MGNVGPVVHCAERRRRRRAGAPGSVAPRATTRHRPSDARAPWPRCPSARVASSALPCTTTARSPSHDSRTVTPPAGPRRRQASAWRSVAPRAAPRSRRRATPAASTNAAMQVSGAVRRRQAPQRRQRAARRRPTHRRQLGGDHATRPVVGVGRLDQVRRRRRRSTRSTAGDRAAATCPHERSSVARPASTGQQSRTRPTAAAREDGRRTGRRSPQRRRWRHESSPAHGRWRARRETIVRRSPSTTVADGPAQLVLIAGQAPSCRGIPSLADECDASAAGAVVVHRVHVCRYLARRHDRHDRLAARSTASSACPTNTSARRSIDGRHRVPRSAGATACVPPVAAATASSPPPSSGRRHVAAARASWRSRSPARTQPLVGMRVVVERRRCRGLLVASAQLARRVSPGPGQVRLDACPRSTRAPRPASATERSST